METNNHEPLPVNPDDNAEPQQTRSSGNNNFYNCTFNATANQVVFGGDINMPNTTNIKGDASTVVTAPVGEIATGNADITNQGSGNNYVADFLEVMKEHLRDMTDIGLASTYKNLKEIDPRIQPSMSIIDLTKGYDGKVFSESRDVRDSRDSRVGIDFGISEMELSQLHDSYMGQNPNRVFLLGDVGSGKTTASKLYARMVLKGEVTSLKDIELVHFISISDLQYIPTTPFDLLVSQQVELDDKTVLCGEKWLTENASRTLFVLDGLDQCCEDLSGKLPRVRGPKAKYSTYVILASIISGDLYPGLKILVTSRWNTFWKLAHRLRSSKTVVLNGFDDQSLKNAACTLAGENEGDKIFAAIENTNMLSLCRTPMFLIYAIEVFISNLGNLPDTLTSLLSGVITYFEGSENWKDDDLESLTKLAYRGTIDNRYRFDKNYLREIGIDSSKLDGILTPRTKLRPYQIRPGTGDTTWSFLHQSLQEFLGALGIFDLGQNEFDLFVENELNETKLEIVRKFIYGMVFNPATRKLCEKYFTGKSASLEVCKRTLTKQLGKFLATGVIEDISVISLLQECGSEVISQYKSGIDRISTNDEFPKPQDEYSLMSVISQSVPLTKVQIQQLEMSPFFMELIRGVIDKVGNFKINTAVIGKHMKINHCHELTDLAPKININLITMCTTDNIVCTLLQTWIDVKKAPCKSFALKGRYSNDIFRKTGRFLSEIGADDLWFYQCSLTKAKFEVFRDSIEDGAKLSQLFIFDDAAMEPEVFEVLPTCLSKGCVKLLGLRECGLTKIKIGSLNVGIDRNKVKLEDLYIHGDPNMKPEAYRSVAATIGKACVGRLILVKSEVTNAKLQAFEDAATENHAKMQELQIHNDDLDRTTIQKLPTVVTKTHLTSLILSNCSMKEDKFDEFGDAAKKDSIELEKLGIHNDEKMNADDYRGLGRAIGKACVQTLILGNNKITETKLHEFGDAAEKEHAKLQELHIHNDDLDRKTIQKLPTVVTKTHLTSLSLSNCSMTEDKFDEFGDAAKKDSIELEKLGIHNDEKMNADDYRGLGRAIGKACVQTLIWEKNKITETKLHEFGDAAERECAKLQELQIHNDDLDRTTIQKLPAVVKKTQLTVLSLSNCSMKADKFDEFGDAAKKDSIELEKLGIHNDEKMNADDYRGLGRAIGKACVQTLILGSNKITETKFHEFGDAAEKERAKLRKLEIQNEDLDITTIRKLPTVVMKTQLPSLSLRNCSMTEDKFGALADAAKTDGIQLERLDIMDDKNMDPNAYHSLPSTIAKTCTKYLVLQNNNVTEAKLRAFAAAAENGDFKLEKLGISADEEMNANDYRGLGRAIGKARVQTLVLGKNKITLTKLHLFGYAAEKERAKMQELQIQNEDLKRTTIRKLPTVVKKTQLTSLSLSNCSMKEEKFDEFGDAAQKDSIKLEKLGIFDDENMNTDDYRGLGRAVGKACVQNLTLGNNQISESKLREFGDATEKERAKLQHLEIRNEDMDSSTIRKLPTIATKTRLTCLSFSHCSMTEDKFDELGDAAKKDDIQLEVLEICNDEKMNADACRGLGRAIGKARVQQLNLKNNKISETKLQRIGDAAEKELAKLQSLQILRDDLDRATIGKLPTFLRKTKAPHLVLAQCSMTAEKFDELADAAKRDGIQIPEFQIVDNQMDETAYCGLARAVEKARILELTVYQCNLTEIKLEAFGEEAKANNTKLEKINIGYDPMDAASLHKLAETMKTVDTKGIQFFYCQLTAENLQSFKESVNHNNVKFDRLYITGNDDLDEECYSEIIEICNKANAKLYLEKVLIPAWWMKPYLLKMRPFILSISD